MTRAEIRLTIAFTFAFIAGSYLYARFSVADPHAGQLCVRAHEQWHVESTAGEFGTTVTRSKVLICEEWGRP